MSVAVASLIVVSSGMGAMSSVAGSGSSSGSFSLFNQFQLIISLLLFDDIHMPEEIFAFLTTVKFACFDFKFLDILPIPWIEEKLLSLFDIPVFNHGLQKLNYLSGSVIINYFQLLKMMLVLLIAHICVLPFIWRRLNSKSILAKLITKMRSFFIYSSYIKIYVEAFFFLVLITLLEITNYKKINIPSYIVACLMLIIAVVFVALIPIHYFTQRKKPSELSSSRM